MKRGLETARLGGARPAIPLIVIGCVLFFCSEISAAPPADPPVERPVERPAGEESKPARVTLGDLKRGSSPALDDDAAPDGDAGDDAGSFASEYLRVLGWLSLVVGVVVGAGFLIRRVLPGAPTRGGARITEVLGRTSLGPRHHLVVVRVGERVLVLGLSHDRIEKISEMTEPREVVALSGRTSFSDELAEQESGYEKDRNQGTTKGDLEPYRHEIERLKTMVGNWRLGAGREESRT